jgi:hypothetical protein
MSIFKSQLLLTVCNFTQRKTENLRIKDGMKLIICNNTELCLTEVYLLYIQRDESHQSSNFGMASEKTKDSERNGRRYFRN